MTSVFESVKQCVLNKEDAKSSKIYTNYNSQHKHRTVVYNQGMNPMNNYIKSGGSIVAFIFCVLFVNSLLGLFK